MTPQQSLETFYSMDVDKALATVCWRGIKDQKHMWERLFEILTALAKQQESFKSIRGRFLVDLSADLSEQEEPDDVFQEIWPVSIDLQGVQQLQEKYSQSFEQMRYVMPDTLILCFETDLLLPSQFNSVKVWAFDYVDLENWDLLDIKPITQHDVPEGYTAWLTVINEEEFEEDSTIYMEIVCELSSYAKKIALTLYSGFDIWRPIRFDGTPNEPHGAINFQRLKRVLMNFAEETGGVLLDEP